LTAASATPPIVQVNPDDPAAEVVDRTVAALNAGGVIAFPTDTLYGIGCVLGQAAALERIRVLRQIDPAKRPFTFLLPDIGAVPHYAQAGENAYRIMNRIFPGPYCVELVASPKAGAVTTGPDRPTIGVRIPGSRFCEKVLWALGKPILTVTAKARDGSPLATAAAIAAEYGAAFDLIIDGGEQTGLPSTVVSLVDDWVAVLREGRGPTGTILLA
jgi:tRNA threonylcarbamoyl adenosine modification protein (Sua5/YciO/YrdC/YwlC family)